MRTGRSGSGRRRLAALGALAVLALAPGVARGAQEAVAAAEVESHPDVVWSLLTDFSRWDRVFPSVASLEVLERGERRFALRTRTRVAGMTVRYTLAATVHAAERRLDCTIDPGEPSDVRALDSSWRVTALPGGGSRVELRVRSDAGLSVPRFVERRMTEQRARESVDALAAALADYRVVAAAR